MPANTVCSIAWRATAAGAVGVEDLALNPQDVGDNFSAHLQNALDMRARQRFYWSPVPMWDKSGFKRVMAEFPVRLIHESFAAEYAARPATLDVRALSQGDFEQLPPTYHNHPVTRAKGKYSSPLGYFSDAIPHTKNDSFFVF